VLINFKFFKIHLEMCKLHETGRFVVIKNDCDQIEFDTEAALFHLKQAGRLGIKDALLNLAKIYLGLPHDILSCYSVDVNK
jgi:elongation factor 2 kinase